MRHKTPAVVQHGSKAAPLDQVQLAYENNANEENALSCEEGGGGIKMDGDEGMPQSHMPFDGMSMPQSVMTGTNPDDVSAKSSASYGNIDNQVHTAQGHPAHDGMTESMPLMAQVVSIASRPEELTNKNGKDVWLCVHCGGTFGEKGNLARHIRIVHDKVKEHACAECGKAFGQKGDLVKHIKTIHDMERSFNCPICSKQFSEKGNMTRHMRTVHKADDKGLPKKQKTERVEVTYPAETEESGSQEKKICVALASPIPGTLITMAHPLPTT